MVDWERLSEKLEDVADDLLEFPKMTAVITTLAIFGAAIPTASCYEIFWKGIRKLDVEISEQVGRGYVDPSKLESITCLEADKKEACVPVLQYEGKKFILQYDGSHITGSPYEIKAVK